MYALHFNARVQENNSMNNIAFSEFGQANPGKQLITE
jgi:hypothetical protein